MDSRLFYPDDFDTVNSSGFGSVLFNVVVGDSANSNRCTVGLSCDTADGDELPVRLGEGLYWFHSVVLATPGVSTGSLYCDFSC